MGMFIKFDVDEARHKEAEACRRCVEVCPVDVFRIEGGRLRVVAENEDECILCDQCLARCPTKAITLRKLYVD